MKAHCDNCDAVIVDVEPRVTIQPWGYQCAVYVQIRKGPTDQQLCVDCLRAAAIAFAEALPSRRVPKVGVTDFTSPGTSSLDVVGTEGGKASVETVSWGDKREKS
jgi:hypothetical protein